MSFASWIERHENTLVPLVAFEDPQCVGGSVTSHSGVSARGAVLSVVNVFPSHVSVRGAVVSVAVKCPSQRAGRSQCIMTALASAQPPSHPASPTEIIASTVAVAKPGTFFLSIIILLT